MSVAPIVKQDVFAFAPQSNVVGTSDQWLDILAYVNKVDLSRVGTDDDTRMARIFLAAHIGQLSKNAVNGSAGPVTSESAGGVRRSYGLIAQATSSGGLGSTRYGQMYLDILGMTAAIGAGVGVSEDGVTVNDAGWKTVKRIEKLGSFEIHAGILGAKADEPHGDGRITFGEAMIINEFGTKDKHVPPRRVLRDVAQHPDLQAQLAVVVRQVVIEGVAPEAALKSAGEHVVQEIRTAIARGVSPANAPSTVQQKHSDIPLIDTGALMNAIEARVVPASGASLDDAYEAFNVGEAL